MKDETKIVTAGRDPKSNFGIVNPPVYHASTVLAPTYAAWKELRERSGKGERTIAYGRRGTPTQFGLEDLVNAVEGGDRCALFPSGLAAITTAMMAYVSQGDHILLVDSAYAPARRVCTELLPRYGVETTWYDPLIAPADLAALIRPNTRIVYVESPGSQTFEVMDIPALAEVAHKAGCIVMMDNTWASPLYFKPFEHGVDVSIQAGTKYIVGHSDVMLGTVTTTEEHFPSLRKMSGDLGMSTGPDDVYLAQRGMRTLHVRLPQHMANGIRLAEWFKGRPEVERVMHPALPDDPGHALWKRDFLGASGLFGVQLKKAPEAATAAFIDELELFGLGASWGGYESLVLVTSPHGVRTATKWPYEGQTLRFHAGLEAPEDQIEDLTRAFDAFNRAAG
ncbi:MAG: cystathionine beta-lyase [Alphaproteobacteria bacterium]